MAFGNGVIYQSFHFHSWGIPRLWARLADEAQRLKDLGFTAVWIPPACKASGGENSTGYDCYDLFDLGEFVTQDHRRDYVHTKYGDKAQLLTAIQTMQGVGLQVYADVVLNHKGGGQQENDVWAVHIDPHDRNRELGDWHTRDVVHTRFDFKDRGDQYSSMKWRHWHFDAVQEGNIYKLNGKRFEQRVSKEKGNYDFLMFCDLDYDHPQVVGETHYWGRWFWDQTRVDGFRLDAVKHIRSFATRDWVRHVRHHAGQDLFTVAEYWSPDVNALHRYLGQTEGVLSLFDVPLHYNLHYASTASPWESFDLRTIFDRTLVREQPAKSVTFVDNHDSQPLESLASWVENWFKPMAYALILLRREGYPCVFEGDRRWDTYEKDGQHTQLTDHSATIDLLLKARQQYNHGDQHDYFTHPNCIGWLRTGDTQHPGVMAVVMSNGEAGYQDMNTHRPGASFTDLTGHLPQTVTADANGWARFPCPARGYSVWVA